ncbi:hypothetical protein ACFOQM_05550 [Paenibacillus sp. GCM10012307]|uniref:Uncharacterized protein n=1 Tax=Paenibacillus roseus TaxID=2798579 RepID=A0A934J4P7_9BACL|nr:hypothetical protein [Paenibacillus roseus]MBJ6360771.1 hypothetical protein [Paenibacillus roseus]
MVINRLKKSFITLLSASLIVGLLLFSASASASTPDGIVNTFSYTPIDSGSSLYRTLAPGATESFKIFNYSSYARAYQVTVSSSGSANYYPSSITITGQGRIYYLAQQPGLYVYDIILQPGAVANIDVSSASYPFTPNNYVISVY